MIEWKININYIISEIIVELIERRNNYYIRFVEVKILNQIIHNVNESVNEINNNIITLIQFILW